MKSFFYFFCLFCTCVFAGYASERSLDWIDHYVLAQESIDTQDEIAIEEYSKAIELKSTESFLYVQRGELLNKMQSWEEAAKDFTAVIESPHVHVSVLLHALYGRAKSLFMLDAIKYAEQIASDYQRAREIDTSKVYCFANENYSIEWNIPEGDIHNPEFKKNYAESVVNSHECNSVNDVYFYDNWTIVKKLSNLVDPSIQDNNKTMDWIDHYALAQEAVGRKDGDGAIREFTEAMQLHPDELLLYVLRGQIFDKKHMWREAEKDFSYVINSPHVDPSILLHALYGRFRARLKILGFQNYIFENESHQEIDHDFAEASAKDTSEIVSFENDTYSIQWNVSKEKIQNALFVKEYTDFMLQYQTCESSDDIHFYDNQTIIKKLRKKECCQKCQQSVEKKSLQTCVGCGGSLKDIFLGYEQQNQNCYYWCDRVALMARGMCIKAFKSESCLFVCNEVVDRTKGWCYSCCYGDGFYKNCVKPFEDFLARVGCEDPIW